MRTVDEIAKSFGVRVYDTALPQDWVDDFHRKIGIYPAGNGMFVWSYDINRIFGAPFPLTDEANRLLMIYNQNTNGR